MKTNTTLTTLALIAALLVSGINKVSAQEVAETSTTPSLMLSFTGTSQTNTADLSWVMENETNCKWFVVERSGDDGGFDSISVVLGINNGNTTNYSFTDANMLQGCNIYRLREVDLTGAERYSKVIMLNNLQSSSAKMDVYPNPAVATINFSIASPAAQQILVQVYSLSGVMMSSTQQELSVGNNLQTIAVGNLRAGNYILKVSSTTGATQYVQPFVKII
jgi:trimeric autotransporter adhesin